MYASTTGMDLDGAVSLFRRHYGKHHRTPIYYHHTDAQETFECAEGSPADCTVTTVVEENQGYSTGKVLRVSKGLLTRKSTEKNSCPAGYKLWAPPSKADWEIIYNALGNSNGNYPRKPHLIIDVTIPEDKNCGGCKKFAMNSDVPEQSAWRTSDGGPWWI